MNLSVIFHGDWEVYAHRDPVSGKRELLQEHIVRCEKYRIRISQERKLLKIEENFLTKLGLDKDDFAGKLVKEMIDAVILFHDLGKGTPAFQKNKMGNPNTIPTKYWGDDSSHSFYPQFLYLDFYLYEIKNGFNKVEKEQKKAVDCTCLGTVLCNRKTSQQFRIYGSISEKLSVESRGTAEKVERRTGSRDFPNCVIFTRSR